MERDYYTILGVARDAQLADIKRAYRKLAMQHHPDKNQGNPDSEAKFKEAAEAYEVLKDDNKRAQYDQFGHDAFKNGGGQGGFSGGGGGFSDIFEDIFSEFMGGGRGGQSQQHGNDLRYNLSITLEEAFNGKQASIRIPTAVKCEECTGTGAAKGTKASSCSMCNGHGKVRAQQGFFTIERTCPSCHGAGQRIENPCKKCHGRGNVKKEKNISATIPAGVEDGTRLRLAGEGEAGLHGAPAGDLYIFIDIPQHEFFERQGADLFCRIPIKMAQAALGATIEVPTIEGKIAKVQVSPGSQTGQQLRLRSKGMPLIQSAVRGNLYIEITVETPVKLTERQKELLREFDECDKDKKCSPKSEGFFTKLKKFFTDDDK
jgi:molecular chaperone DnaJ